MEKNLPELLFVSVVVIQAEYHRMFLVEGAIHKRLREKH